MTVARRPDDPRQALGRVGESAAEAALIRAGLTVVERRYRRRGGEIDLIAEDDERIVFVEVKTRRGLGYGRPAEAVTVAKQRRMARVARRYLAERREAERRCRFDVVEVYVRGRTVETVRHLKDAFRPGSDG